MPQTVGAAVPVAKSDKLVTLMGRRICLVDRESGTVNLYGYTGVTTRRMWYNWFVARLVLFACNEVVSVLSVQYWFQ